MSKWEDELEFAPLTMRTTWMSDKLASEFLKQPVQITVGNATEALANWSYTTEITDGSFQVIHNDVENPYL